MAEHDRSDPLAGLTEDEADQAIERLAAKVDGGIGGKAASDHLKEMKAARKRLQPPVPLDQRAPGVNAYAEPAQITVEGGGR